MNYDKIIHVDFPKICGRSNGFLPKQIKVINLANSKKVDVVMYSGAFRAGKTIVLAHKSIMTCLENPKCRGLLGALTSTRLSSVVFREFLDEMDRYQNELTKAGIDLKIAKKIIHSQGKKMVEFYNGSTVEFRSCDDERKLSGYTLDFFGLDEAVDMEEEVFTQLIGRISGTGNLENPFGMIATNPADELHWLYKYFYYSDKDPKFVAVDTNTRENVLLPDYDNYIKRLEKAWDKDWILRYLDGRWGMFSGAIYKEFDPKKHMGDFRNLPVKYKIAGVDWGLRDPYVILIGGVTRDDRLVILYEYYGTNKSSHEVAKLLADLHEEHNFKKVYCDPSAADLILQSWRLGVPSGKKASNGEIKSFANNDIKSGIARMQSLFKNDFIMIDKDCNYFKKQHLAYRYSEGTEKPIDRENHTCDAARYMTTDFNPFRNDNVFEVIYHKFNKWS